MIRTSSRTRAARCASDRLNAIGCIPISLARWEMTGLDDEIRRLAADVSSP
jgi:hypothetical protein